jgi:hypothetical protein
MPVAAGDVRLKYSTKVGAAGNANAGNAAGSLGKYISTTEITSAVANNLFDDVSASENAASDVEYRCFFLHNAHATSTFENVKMWIQSEVAGGTSFAIGVDPAAASAIGAAPAQAAEVANENVAPVGVVFSSPVDQTSGINIGNIPPGQCRAVWVRRTAANTVAVSGDGGTFRVFGESV